MDRTEVGKVMKTTMITKVGNDGGLEHGSYTKVSVLTLRVFPEIQP